MVVLHADASAWPFPWGPRTLILFCNPSLQGGSHTMPPPVGARCTWRQARQRLGGQQQYQHPGGKCTRWRLDARANVVLHLGKEAYAAAARRCRARGTGKRGLCGLTGSCTAATMCAGSANRHRGRKANETVIKKEGAWVQASRAQRRHRVDAQGVGDRSVWG